MKARNMVLWLKTGMMMLFVMIFLSITALAQEEIQLGETERAWWSDTTTARWKKVDKANEYQVRLYDENGDSVIRLTVDTTYADFASYMRDGHDYYFEVRAVATRSQQAYTENGEWVQSAYQTAENIGDVSGRFRDYSEGRKYQTRTGEYITNQWYLIEGDWYYFKEDGYMATGWQMVNNLWYYLAEDGKMETGWKQIDGNWYYLRDNGSMATGWLESKPGQWYYLNPNGSMAVNTVVDGCTLNERGLWVS